MRIRIETIFRKNVNKRYNILLTSVFSGNNEARKYYIFLGFTYELETGFEPATC